MWVARQVAPFRSFHLTFPPRDISPEPGHHKESSKHLRRRATDAVSSARRRDIRGLDNIRSSSGYGHRDGLSINTQLSRNVLRSSREHYGDTPFLWARAATANGTLQVGTNPPISSVISAARWRTSVLNLVIELGLSPKTVRNGWCRMLRLWRPGASRCLRTRPTRSTIICMYYRQQRREAESLSPPTR